MNSDSRSSSSSYRTKQGENVLEVFKAHSGEHLTIEEISEYLRKRNTPVGTATVYRNVEKLIEGGLVRKYAIDGTTSACFQYTGDTSCREHFHLKCTKCGKLFHATCPFLDGISEHIFEHHGFTVDNTRTVFYGICDSCLRSDRKRESNEK